MPNQNTETEQQTKPSRAFASRKEILAVLVESQAKEHEYYGATAVAVGKHMQKLCAAWIALLLNQVRNGAPAVNDRFFNATGVRWDQLNAWRSALRAHEHAEIELTNAQKALAATEQARGKFAGMLWGAKKGYEQQYEAGDKLVKKAKADHEQQERRAVEAERALDAVAEALLRDCISKSAVVSTSTEFGLEIARVLQAMQHEAQTMEQRHSQEQQRLLASADRALSVLASHYRKS